MENPFKMHHLGVPLFLEASIWVITATNEGFTWVPMEVSVRQLFWVVRTLWVFCFSVGEKRVEKKESSQEKARNDRLSDYKGRNQN